MNSHPPTYKQFLVRELAWVISSPPLRSGIIDDTNWWSFQKCQQEYQSCLPSLLKLDKNPAPLEQHLENQKSMRLGHRFEALVSYWLSISPNYELLEQNIQIIEGGITRGEIDFIIQEIATGKLIHLEVSVKFYLGTEPYHDTYRWFGINTKDQLGKKLDHLLQHQSQLSKRYADYLSHRIDEHHCLIKGRLFYPSGIYSKPKGITKNHLRGSWDYEKDMEMNTDDYLAIDKSHWLSELTPIDIASLLNKPMRKYEKRAQCYIEINKDEEDILREIRRFFILPNDFYFPDKK